MVFEGKQNKPYDRIVARSKSADSQHRLKKRDYRVQTEDAQDAEGSRVKLQLEVNRQKPINNVARRFRKK